MDNPQRPSAQRLQKPHVFVKLEFGVSWSGQHSPRRRGFEYKSRGLRKRYPDFPRHVPAPTTNYLAPASSQQQQQIPSLDLHDEARSTHEARPHARDAPPPDCTSVGYLVPEHHESPRGRSRHLEAIPEPSPLGSVFTRESTAFSGERHERGNSAPPPLSDNNWDVVHQQASLQDVVGPSYEHATAHAQTPLDVWKDLPDVPTHFRLGDEGLPWEGTWTFPMGFEPFLEPDPYVRPESSCSSPKPSTTRRRPAPSEQRSADLVSMSSPLAQVQSPPLPPLGEESIRMYELEALGSAMMTVDNGFESQWWNQEERGERRQLVALHPPAATEQQAEQQMGFGWVGAPLSTTAPGDTLSNRYMADRGEFSFSRHSTGDLPSQQDMVVSPMSSFSGPVRNESRTMATRSDELWFSGRYE